MVERKACVRGELRRALYGAGIGGLSFRYVLEIVWIPKLPLMQAIGLNPSTATEIVDDPTLRRLKRFASRWGYGGLVMTNVSAYRATDPGEMLRMAKLGHFGPEQTPEFLASFAASGAVDLVVGCWGAHGGSRFLAPRVQAIREVFGVALHCIGDELTSNAQPKHPLYLRGSLRARRLRELEEERAA